MDSARHGQPQKSKIKVTETSTHDTVTKKHSPQRAWRKKSKCKPLKKPVSREKEKDCECWAKTSCRHLLCPANREIQAPLTELTLKQTNKQTNNSQTYCSSRETTLKNHALSENGGVSSDFGFVSFALLGRVTGGGLHPLERDAGLRSFSKNLA